MENLFTTHLPSKGNIANVLFWRLHADMSACPHVLKWLIDGRIKMYTSNIRWTHITSTSPISSCRCGGGRSTCVGRWFKSFGSTRCVTCLLEERMTSDSPGLHISIKAFRCLGWEATRKVTQHFPLTSEPGQLILARQPEAAFTGFFFVCLFVSCFFICTEKHKCVRQFDLPKH